VEIIYLAGGRRVRAAVRRRSRRPVLERVRQPDQPFIMIRTTHPRSCRRPRRQPRRDAAPCNSLRQPAPQHQDHHDSGDPPRRAVGTRPSARGRAVPAAIRAQIRAHDPVPGLRIVHCRRAPSPHSASKPAPSGPPPPSPALTRRPRARKPPIPACHPACPHPRHTGQEPGTHPPEALSGQRPGVRRRDSQPAPARGASAAAGGSGRPADWPAGVRTSGPLPLTRAQLRADPGRRVAGPGNRAAVRQRSGMGGHGTSAAGPLAPAGGAQARDRPVPVPDGHRGRYGRAAWQCASGGRQDIDAA